MSERHKVDALICFAEVIDHMLVTFFVFNADAGHDYGTIETKGYHKMIVRREGKPEVVDNPQWA